MRVVCDNCGASYKIPDSKLTREVNKATCRKCGNPILIRRPEMAAKETAAHGPNPTTEERTLITSAAELERQARMRASSASHPGMDDAAMDPRPTQVSPDNSHTEATVPRDEAAERAVAAMQAPSDASTIVQSPTSYVSTTLVPENLGPPRAAASPPPSMQVPGPIPPPAPMNQARAVAAYVPAAPPPLAPPGVAPAPSVVAPASYAPAPVPAAAPPPAHVPTPSPAASAPPPPPAPAPRAVPAAAPSTGGFSPAGDLTVALLLSLLSVFGVLLILVNGLVGSTIVAGLGTFLALLGGVGSALVVLTGNRGTRKASIPLAVGGGFVLAFMGGVGQGAVNWAASFDAGGEEPEPPAVVTKKVEPPPAPVETPKAPEPDPALTLAAPPAEAVAPPPAEAVAPPPAPAPVVATPAPAPVVATPAPTKSTSTTTSSKSTSSAPSSSTPERIQPKTTSTPASTPSTSTSTKSTSTSTPSTSTKSTSSSSTTAKAAEPEAAPAKAAALDTRVIDTMIKNNKGVKLCFIKQKNDGGSLPSGVKVKLTVQPSGTVSSAKIPSGEWKDTDFDGCLSGAVKSIQFPPFDGDPLTITYPFPI